MAKNKAQTPAGRRHIYVPSRGPTKTFLKNGQWVEKRTTSPIYVCDCGVRYLKTRPDQKTCLQCVNRPPQKHGR
jgi:hypothetical protein